MIIATLTSNLFARGTRALLNSVVAQSGLDVSQKVVICVADRTGGPDMSHIEQTIGDGHRCRFIQAESTIQDRIKTGSIAAKKIPRLGKLSIFAVEADEPILFIDSDAVCLGPLTSLPEKCFFAAAPNTGKRQALEIDGRPVFNSGVMLFRPDPRLFDDIMQHAAENPELIGEKADQDLLNDFFFRRDSNAVLTLHQKYNAIISAKRNIRSWNQLKHQGIRILHFTDLKPWARERYIMRRMFRWELRQWERFS